MAASVGGQRQQRKGGSRAAGRQRQRGGSRAVLVAKQRRQSGCRAAEQ
jgi:hypothetical protein